MEKEQKNGFSIVGIIVIMAAVAVLGGGYWYWQASIEIPPEVPPGIKDEIDAPTLAPSDIEGWKTYRNEEYGFEVRYPSDLKVGEGRPNIYKEFSVNKDGIGFSTDFDSNSNTEFEIYIFSDNEIYEFNRTSKGPLFLNRKRHESTQKPTVISVGGVLATEVNVSQSALEITKPYIKNVYFSEGSVIYVFATRVGGQDWTVEKSQKRVDRFYQILATFRFTEPILETGPGTYCDSDKDCWCQGFTGSEFLKNTVESTCNTETNRCNICLYL